MSHKQGPTAPGTSVSPPQAPGSPEIDATHTFKIVTTKRTLLLCAPSEDDEIKWLGAIRALISRRMESGQVPGKISKSRSPEAMRSETVSGVLTEAGATSVAGPSGSSGLKGKVRRLSGAVHPEQDLKEVKSA